MNLLHGLRAIDRKLVRDLWRMRGQALAIALVAMCGIATFVSMRSGYEALVASQAVYYEQYRFADVFAPLKRAPLSLLDRVREISGVNDVDGRVVFDASLDVPGLDEPASGRLVSLPLRPGGGLNRVHLRSGLPARGSRPGSERARSGHHSSPRASTGRRRPRRRVRSWFGSRGGVCGLPPKSMASAPAAGFTSGKR